MPPLDLSDMQDDSGMDQNSEASPIHSQDTYGGTQLEPIFSFASTEFGRLSGRKIRTCRGNLPYDMWDNTASDMLPPTMPAASPVPIPVSQMKSKRFLSSPIGLYQDSISEHASLNPRGEAWTMPADPLPYRDPVHKGPASGVCQLYDHLKPLSDFDNRDRVRNHGWNEHNQHCSFKKRIKRDQRKNLTDERTKARRESIALLILHRKLSCFTRV